MERVYRTGLDLDVALTAASRRTLTAAVMPAQPAAAAASDAGPATEAALADTGSTVRQDLRVRIKRWLRRPAALTFRLLKPFLRPVAFRTRRYLTETMHHDTLRTVDAARHEVQRASSEVLREVQSAREMLRQEVLAAQAQSSLEQRRLFTGLLQEQQATRDLVRRLLTGAQQRGMADAANAVEAVRVQLLETQQRGAAGIADAIDAVRLQLVETQQHGAGALSHAIDAVRTQLLDAQQQGASGLSSAIDAARTQLLDAQGRGAADVVNATNSVREQLLDAQQRHAADLAAAIGAGNANMAQTVAASTTDTAAMLLSNLAPRLDRLEQYGYTSARRSIMHCAAGEVMIKTEVGYVMCEDSDLAVLACLADTGDIERGTRLLIERLLQPGDTFVDVGANVGMHTLAAGRALRGSGCIVAFEPFEKTRRLLEKSLWINGLDALATVHGSAVSDREGVQSLFLGASSGHHSLYALGNDALDAAHVQVPTVRLESVIAPGQRIDLLKIDAEGAELEVLRGALAVVEANPDIALIVEFGPAHLMRTAHGAGDWLAAFTSLGLDYRAIDAVDGTLSGTSVAQLESEVSTNLFFARPGTASWKRLGVAA